MQILTPQKGISRYSNVARLAREVIFNAPLSQQHTSPVAFPHVEPLPEKGFSLVVNTLSEETSYTLPMQELVADTAKTALEYLQARLNSAGFTVLNSTQWAQLKGQHLRLAA